MTRAPVVSAVLFAFAFVFALGCDCGGDPPGGRSCDTSRDCRTGEMCIDNACTRGQDGAVPGLDAMPIDAPTSRIVSVRIEPATATLESIDGSRPTVDFMAISVFDDGVERPSNGPSFTIDNVSLGDLDEPSGEFAANGVIGGAATVTLSVPGPGGTVLTATAPLTVSIRRTLRGDGVTDEDVTRIDALTPVDDAARSAVVYPLDGVVMPQNVYPADVQWTTSAPGDLFRVTITKPSATVRAYLAYDPAMHWLVDETAWRSLAQTDPDAPAQLVVDRLEAASGQLVRSATIHMTFARAALTGSVYYWDIEAGRIVRIDDGAGSATSFMPTPPASPWTGENCVGCHSVSNSGRFMAGRLGGGNNIGGLFDLTTDLSANPAPTVYPLTASSLTWWFSSWSPDDTRLVVAYNDHDAATRQLRFYDPFAGTQVPISGTAPSGTHPAWSPDGTRIAYVEGANSWGGEFTTGNIAILPVPAADTVGSPVTIHVASTIPGSTADSYPTWSPDSQRIAFANGGGSRSERDLSSLYVMSGDGTGVTHLARASSAARLDYQPRFSPFTSGDPPEYYWMSFLSRRDYGNAPRGNVTRPLTRRQQIWVAAIRVGAAPGEDPSAVPYWLPGQNPLSANISAYWAPRPCREDGEGCSVGSECCGGDCRPPAGGGAPVCSPPPPENCRESGETCSTTADCCPDMGLTCINRVCVAGPG
ncbi:PD40 domain-containing protein [Sandaracinus amylolyticus]|uniref:TolB protein n=1 Tax=Sandaracinus amylolyticus TaxID=927083 RepID=A0A0F6YJI2_9BACT|nr:PD40 domain-containing protein [Sandaracinus amylolyticus]AKF07851.1 tolB protein precursor [Sandaracinus amylolyticus]